MVSRRSLVQWGPELGGRPESKIALSLEYVINNLIA
jgi:hypothetical protein